MIKRYRAVYKAGDRGPWVNGIPSIMDLQNNEWVVGLEWEHIPPKCGATSRVEVDGQPLKCENTACKGGSHAMWYETHDTHGNTEYLEITWHDKEDEL